MKIFFSELLASMFFIVLSGFCLLESRQVHLYPVVSGIAALILFLAMYAHTKIHLNPIVSIGYISKGELPLSDGVSRILAQLLGAVLGVLVLSVVVPYESKSYPGYVMSQVFAVEFILSLLLVIAFFSVVSSHFSSIGQKALSLGIVVGGVIAVSAFVANDFSGGILSPSLLVALILMRIVPAEYWLAYLIAQTLAAVVGVSIVSMLSDKSHKTLD